MVPVLAHERCCGELRLSPLRTQRLRHESVLGRRKLIFQLRDSMPMPSLGHKRSRFAVGHRFGHISWALLLSVVNTQGLDTCERV